MEMSITATGKMPAMTLEEVGARKVYLISMVEQRLRTLLVHTACDIVLKLQLSGVDFTEPTSEIHINSWKCDTKAAVQTGDAASVHIALPISIFNQVCSSQDKSPFYSVQAGVKMVEPETPPPAGSITIGGNDYVVEHDNDFMEIVRVQLLNLSIRRLEEILLALLVLSARLDEYVVATQIGDIYNCARIPIVSDEVVPILLQVADDEMKQVVASYQNALGNDCKERK